MKRKRKIFIGSKANMFFKANGNAAAGLPISFALNISFLPFFAKMLGSQDYAVVILAAGLISIPFYWASVARMFVIDWAYVRYQIDISPKALFSNLYKKLRAL